MSLLLLSGEGEPILADENLEIGALKFFKNKLAKFRRYNSQVKLWVKKLESSKVPSGQILDPANQHILIDFLAELNHSKKY